MTQRAATGAVYTAGLLQGFALVTFPAASAVFTNPGAYALSNAQYGALFAPQTITAVAASLLGGRVGRRLGDKRVLILGLGANLAAMTLLLTSWLFVSAHALAFALLLGATSLLGMGFGLTVPALNGSAAALYPKRADAALLALNALLGLGTALAPLSVSVLVDNGLWWAVPCSVGALLSTLIVWTSRVFLARPTRGSPEPSKMSKQFWLFAAFALLYGVVETMNGAWAIVYMKSVVGATASLAALALTVFWAATTAGRVLFASIERSFLPRNTFRLLPWVLGVAFLATACLPASPPAFGPTAFGLAGLGCSALLPLVMSFGGEDAPPGKLIASYQVGYGLAAFGMGPLHDAAGVGWRALFGCAAGLALAMSALSVRIVRSLSQRQAGSSSASS